MAPQIALQFPIPHASRDLVRLKVPATSDIVERPRLLSRNDTAAGLVEVLHRELRRLEDRRADDDVAVTVADRCAEADHRDRHAAAKDRLCTQRLGEVDRPARAAVYAGERGLDYGGADTRGARLLVCGMLV